MPQYGIGASGSSAAACMKERSASLAQKECICATPWLKNSCAFAFDVVIGKLIWPCPDRILAGSDGAAPPGGGAHMSFGFASGDFDSAANKLSEPSRKAAT